MGFEQKISANNRYSLNLKELWLYRELFYFFTWRDIKVKYKQSVLGFLWAVLQPIILTVIIAYFFGELMGMSEKTSPIPYSIFVFSGLILWNIFSSGLSGAGNSMVNNANIIKKIYFPRMVIPISAVLVAIFDFIMAFAVFLVLLVYYDVQSIFPVNYIRCLAIVPICVVLTIIATLGLGLLIGALNVKYRDFKYIIPFFLQIMLFLTPVIYPISFVTAPWAKYLLAINPMSAPISLIKYGIIEYQFEWQYIIISLCSSLVLFITGLAYFKKTEAYFADLA